MGDLILIITLGVNDEVSKCHEQDDTVCYGKITNLTLRSKFKVKGHQQWYSTHRLEVVYLHAKYAKPVLNDKKVTAQKRFVTDARTDPRTDRLITIGRPPQSGRNLIIDIM